MKKVAIMQPYFFPYLGYFQLIDSVDIYVNLDHVSFMPRSYMTRNVIKDNLSINVPVLNGSQNRKCNEVEVDINEKYVSKFQKTLQHKYGKEKNFSFVMSELIEPTFKSTNKTISQFNIELIKSICELIGIQTEIIETSSHFNCLELKKEECLMSIVSELNSAIYVNAIGGQKIYNKESFKQKGIDLYFVKTGILNYPNQYASILDLLFTQEIDSIKKELKNYSLV
jgi:hypothetical protein